MAKCHLYWYLYARSHSVHLTLRSLTVHNLHFCFYALNNPPMILCFEVASITERASYESVYYTCKNCNCVSILVNARLFSQSQKIVLYNNEGTSYVGRFLTSPIHLAGSICCSYICKKNSDSF